MGLKDLFKKKKEVIVEKPVEIIDKKATKVAKSVKMKTVSADDIYSKYFDVIKKEVATHFHEEAKEIIRLTNNETRNQFLEYHKKNQGNICCMVLDKAKHDLIKEGKLQHKEGDAFGNPFML